MYSTSCCVTLCMLICCSVFIAPSASSHIRNARRSVKSCGKPCVIPNARYIKGKCLVPIHCTTKLPMLRTRTLRDNYVAVNNRLYRAYRAVYTSHCAIRGTTFNKQLRLCLKPAKCSGNNLPISDGPLTQLYYILKYKLYKAYPSLCA